MSLKKEEKKKSKATSDESLKPKLISQTRNSKNLKLGFNQKDHFLNSVMLKYETKKKSIFFQSNTNNNKKNKDLI
jgi:hypothetical protein